MTAHLLIGLATGGGLGFGCSKLGGCATGMCPLTRSPWIDPIFGAMLGALIASSFK